LGRDRQKLLLIAAKVQDSSVMNDCWKRKCCKYQAVEKEVLSRKMDISTILKTAPFP